MNASKRWVRIDAAVTATEAHTLAISHNHLEFSNKKQNNKSHTLYERSCVHRIVKRKKTKREKNCETKKRNRDSFFYSKRNGIRWKKENQQNEKRINAKIAIKIFGWTNFGFWLMVFLIIVIREAKQRPDLSWNRWYLVFHKCVLKAWDEQAKICDKTCRLLVAPVLLCVHTEWATKRACVCVCATKKSEVQKCHKLFSFYCLRKCSRANGTLESI